MESCETCSVMALVNVMGSRAAFVTGSITKVEHVTVMNDGMTRVLSFELKT